MTNPHSYQKWRTSRTWPGGGWGEAMVQVRKDQRLTQRDIADHLGVSLATVRKWEDGAALPERLLWSKLEEAMGMPVPDPRVPDHTPAERELIDTMLLVVDELRLLRQRLAEAPAAATPLPAESQDPKLLDVNGAASYLGVSTSFVRSLVAGRRVVHYKIGGRVMFKREDLDQFVDQNKRGLPDVTPWQLQGRRGKSPRTPAVKDKPRPAATKQRRPSKAEIANKRWTVAELADRWWGGESARALLARAGIATDERAEEAEATFRYGDLLGWAESHNAEFGDWLQEYDPSLHSGLGAGQNR